jgi:hypothetical protein
VAGSAINVRAYASASLVYQQQLSTNNGEIDGQFGLLHSWAWSTTPPPQGIDVQDARTYARIIYPGYYMLTAQITMSGSVDITRGVAFSVDGVFVHMATSVTMTCNRFGESYCYQWVDTEHVIYRDRNSKVEVWASSGMLMYRDIPDDRAYTAAYTGFHSLMNGFFTLTRIDVPM